MVEVACNGRGSSSCGTTDRASSADDLPHMFDRFYRAPAARGLPGSGLGLAIVAQVARDEGGSVNADHGRRRRLMFRFSLPEVPAPDVRGATVRID